MDVDVDLDRLLAPDQLSTARFTRRYDDADNDESEDDTDYGYRDPSRSRASWEWDLADYVM